MRDLGVYLYHVTEIASVLNYWFDIHGIVFDPRYPKPIASMVFEGRLRLQHLVDRGAEADPWYQLTPNHLRVSISCADSA